MDFNIPKTNKDYEKPLNSELKGEPIPPPYHEEELLTAGEVASILKCSKSVIYGYARRRVIPSVKIGGMIRFRGADLNAAINGLGVLSTEHFTGEERR